VVQWVESQSKELRLARTEGLGSSLSIIDDSTSEAVEEAAKDCLREVSGFISGEME